MTRWWLIGAAVFLVALLIASIALALLSEDAEFAPGTPEHAVQSLLRAAENDDIEAAYGMLSAELQDRCELKNFVDGGRYGSSDDRDFRATLRDTRVLDDITFVRLRITRFHSDGPFDSSQSYYDQQFTLQQENGEWKFTEYPWPYDYCHESDE